MRARIALALLLLAVLSGCGQAKLVKVEGIALLDGKPIEGATVVFMPEGTPGRPAQGMTASDGSFSLSTSSEQGAGPGNYKVVVMKTTGILPPGAVPPSPDEERKMIKRRQDFAKHSEKYLQSLLPPLYGTAATTPLRCTVPPEGPVVLKLVNHP